jgi:hypothetical protein
MSKERKNPVSGDEVEPLETPSDACPAWADQLIKELLVLEIRLGNVQPLPDAGEEWQSADLEELEQRLAAREGSGAIDEATTESIFKRVVTGLAGEGFSAAQITAFVNTRVVGQSRLPYCGLAEVEETLRSQIH